MYGGIVEIAGASNLELLRQPRASRLWGRLSGLPMSGSQERQSGKPAPQDSRVTTVSHRSLDLMGIIMTHSTSDLSGESSQHLP